MPETILNVEENGMSILVSPLNWGFGHATRVIPLIRALQKQGYSITLGGNGVSLLVLQKEFPRLPWLPIPFPLVRYGRGRQQVHLFILHSFRLLWGIRQEHRALGKILQSRHFDIIISDSRPGLYYKGYRTIIITHQLHIQFPKGWGLPGRLVNGMNRHYLKKFSEIWVPDSAGEVNLAGRLSHPTLRGLTVRYIGPISRYQAWLDEPLREDFILVMLGGPEPQRGILEQMLIGELARTGREAVIAAGNPGGKSLNLPPNVRYHPFADSAAMEQLIRRAGVIIGRSGYTTVMELSSLRRSAILIPTPGQPEQEYLGEWLQSKGYFLCFSQAGFGLEAALRAWSQFEPAYPEVSFNGFPLSDGLFQKQND